MAVLLQRMGQFALPQDIPSIQRSQYLADALQQLQQSGGQNLRTPTALWGNLGATALLQFARRRQDRELMQAMGNNQNALTGQLSNLMGGPPSAAPDASTSAPPTAMPPPQSAAPPAPETAPTPPPPDLAAKYGQGTLDRLARLIIGEDPNHGKEVASVVVNRANAAHMPIQDVISAPHQFEPFNNPTTWGKLSAIDPTDPKYKQAMADALAVLSNGPTTPADHFYSPGAQAALGRPMPAWDNGSGQDIGAQRYFKLGYSAPRGYQPPNSLPQAPVGAQAPGPAGAAPSGPAGAPPIAPPIPAMGGQPPQQMQPQGDPLAQAKVAMQAAAAHGAGPTQEEWNLFRSLANNPRTFPQAQELAMKIAQRRASHPEVSMAGTFVGADNQLHSGNQWVLTQHGPGGDVYTNVLTGEPKTVANQNIGAIPPGSTIGFGQGGGVQVTPMQGVQAQTSGPLASGSVTETDPITHKTTVIQQPQVDPGKVQSAITEFYGSDDYRLAAKTTAALNSLHRAISAAGGNNGVLGMAAVDNLVQAQTGLSARQGSVSMLIDNIGVPDQIKGAILKVTGNGSVTPRVLQQMDSVLNSYATTHRDIAQQHLDALNNLYKPSGYNLGVTLPPLEPLPKVQWLNDGQQAQPQQTPAMQRHPQAQVAAERLQALGFHQDDKGRWVDKDGNPPR